MWGNDKRVRITTIAVVIGLVLIAFVGVETPVAHGLDFMSLPGHRRSPAPWSSQIDTIKDVLETKWLNLNTCL